MCLCPIPIFIIIAFVFLFVKRNCSHQHRTSRTEGGNDSDADGGARVRSHRTAKENSLDGVCFGCFFISKNRIFHTREPPISNQFHVNLIGGIIVKKFFKQIFKRYQKLIPLTCIIVLKEGGDGYAR